MSSSRPPVRPAGRGPSQPPASPGRNGGGRRVRITGRGWAALIGLGLVVVLVAGWVVSRGGSGEPRATGTSRSATGTSGELPTTPASSDTTDPSPRVQALPACAYAVLPAPDATYGQWQRTLLDTTFALPGDYAPSDLVSVSQAGSETPELVRSIVIPDLKVLLQASVAAGNPVDVLIGYRSYARQDALFRDHVRTEGRAEALASTARPGHSEHQLGTTVDFRTKGELDVPKNWAQQPAGAWMEANSWRFGFVESYPHGHEDVTCYRYEPWHYRYLGRAMAKRVHDSGLTLREFLWRLDSSHSPTPAGTSSP